jgi:hypothetical protein
MPALLIAAALAWSVASPDGRTAIAISQQEDGRLTYRVTHAGVTVLDESPLGIRRADQDFSDRLRFLSASTVPSVDDRYPMPHGKRREHHAVGRQQTLTFTNAAGARLELIVRADNDGVAFRYRFPEHDSQARTVVEELTGFHVPQESTGWLQPQSEPGRYTPAYEDYFNEVRAGDAAPSEQGWDFPALFRIPGATATPSVPAWMLITEAALDESYCGTRLAAEAPNGIYRVRFPDQREGRGVGEVQPASNLPWTLPWRVVIVGDSPGQILESDLVLDLSPPSRVKDASWIRPGRASWSWWSESDSPKHAEALNRFTDLAAEMGWEYALVDANWNVMQSGTIADVVAHAKAKGVSLLFWYNSGGPHNDVTEAPRDRMHTRTVRRAEFAKLRSWGVKGVKVDFWQSDKQDRIRQYRELLADAAAFHLLVDFHGCTVPRGWSREFPNLVSMEGVFGAEQYKFRDHFPARAAAHNTILPFTRNAVGPMDYTPVTFSDAKYPHLTTSAHELALSVVFESGVQHFADSVEAYRALPAPAREFLSQVPAAWDETRVLSGEPGSSIVIARRRGSAWFVGALNGRDAAQTVDVPFAFLGPGTWSASTIRDGDSARAFRDDTRAVTARDSMAIDMAPRGGFVIRLTTP